MAAPFPSIPDENSPNTELILFAIMGGVGAPAPSEPIGQSPNVELILWQILQNGTGPGGPTAWGTISGSLPDQIDLKNALNSKQNILSENFLFVGNNGNATENGALLLNAYALAKTLTPNGQPISSTNRFTIAVMSGYYELSSELNIDTEFIDIVSVTNQCDVFLTNNTINVTADNVKIVGINVGSQRFKIDTLLNNVECVFCKGGVRSFGYNNNLSGKYTNCEGGDLSFGGDGRASGIFINCKAGINSYGNISEGKFINCEGGNNSFGVVEASGEFYNCISGTYSFGGGVGTGKSSGKFYNCIGGTDSWNNEIEGEIFFSKINGTSNFATVSAIGITRYCINGDNSTDNQG